MAHVTDVKETLLDMKSKLQMKIMTQHNYAQDSLHLQQPQKELKVREEKNRRATEIRTSTLCTRCNFSSYKRTEVKTFENKNQID